MVAESAAIAAESPHPWVSRGGVKLAAALKAFSIDPAGLACLDIGASTGGFTDVLLARGAARVHAVDVGRGQLHPRLATDPRIVSLEATDARRLAGLLDPDSFDLATVDVSFISLRLVLPVLVPFLRRGATVVALVKPQFEVGRAGLDRGGIVRDAALREASLAAILDLLPDFGLTLVGQIPSPIAGGDGNLEFLVAARRHG
jgi:23S rRNA (cytidine1920-2'-O)/16S rRNA (cytidine1409-2'-O)-methyltransferase